MTLTEAEALLCCGARATTGRATCNDLRAALEQAPASDLGPAILRATAELAGLLQRPARLAGERQSASIGLKDLRQALAEVAVVAAGLDLARLRFTRSRLRRVYGPRLQQRVDATPGEELDPAGSAGLQ